MSQPPADDRARSDATVTVVLGDPRLPDLAKPDGRFTPEDLEAVARLRSALSSLDGWRFEYLDDHETLVRRLGEAGRGRVLNLCDTGYRNRARQEAHVPALLELMDLDYTGAGPGALTVCYDKAAVRSLAASHGVPVPAEVFVDRREAASFVAEPATPLPALVKPATGDGSEGIDPESVVTTAGALQARVRALARRFPDRDLLVQEFLPGDEYAAGLIGNPGHGFTVLPLLRVDYGGLDPELPRILSYGSKTDPDSPYWRELRYVEGQPEATSRQVMVEASERLFARLGCRDYARFDFREDSDGTPRLLEANPNPAWCWDGKMNLMAELAGWSYARFLEAILEAADRRITGDGD